jgi:hypothetical protein
VRSTVGRTQALCLGVLLLAAAALQSSAGARPPSAEGTQIVTLAVDRFYDESTKLHRFHFSGRVSSLTPGEYVAVLYRKCGQAFSTAVAGTSTTGSGVWGASPIVGLAAGSGTFRARWKNELSRPVTLRPPLDVRAEELGGGKVRVTVFTYEVPHDLRGRLVFLQRLKNGRWSDVRGAKLRRGPSGYWRTYVANFTYAERGATLRAVVPKKSTAPCFTRGATKRWTS